MLPRNRESRAPALDRRRFFGCAIALALGGRAAADDDVDIASYGEPIDTSGMAPGSWRKLLIDAQPVYVRHRTKEEIAGARSEPQSALLDPARDEDRAPDAAWLCVSGVCTHAACTVACGLGPYRGWMCLCHGSVYDMSGRVRHGPAKRNLAVVRYQRNGDQLTLLG
jgi:ubiquinol-cytochrome c reductase iron-sulfur subunit